MKNNKLACVVSIAGTDPSGGAGIQADIKAICATGAYAASIITALVAQNTQGVQYIQTVSPDFVQKQIDSVFSDLEVDAVKIGMLQDIPIIEQLAQALKKLKPKNIVFDPVMVAKDGSSLLNFESLSVLKKQLIPQSFLITPNIFETERLLETSINTSQEMEKAAIELGRAFKVNVLVKGGHLKSEQALDVLYSKEEKKCHWFSSKRIASKNTHGTGCSLSAAIASYLAQDKSLYEAIDLAKAYLTQAILSAQKYPIGQGNGPVDHFYFLDNRIKI